MVTSGISLHNFRTREPERIFEQQHLLDWMEQAYKTAYPEKSIESLIDKYALKDDRIQSRGLNLAQSFVDCTGGFHNFEITPTGPSTKQRCQKFTELTLDTINHFYQDQTPPDHIVHVTCTGYESPSAPQLFINQKDWRATNVTHAYHMGCYASIPAIRMAAGQALLLKSFGNSKPKVDVINTEYASLHYNMSILNTAEQVIVFSLFADGAAHYSLSPSDQLNKGYEIIGIEEYIIPDSLDLMRWVPDSYGFLMRLSPHVPTKVAEYLPEFLEKVANKHQINIDHLLQESRFAIHPGGPKIVDLVQQNLALTDSQVKESKTVLKNRGNMSSATLPHIWELMFHDYERDQYIISLAFGPGLSIFLALFKSI